MQGYSFFREDIEALGEHFKDYHMIQRVEILPYHTLGVHKYEAMKLDYKLKDVKQNTPEQLEEVRALFEKYFQTVYVNLFLVIEQIPYKLPLSFQNIRNTSLMYWLSIRLFLHSKICHFFRKSIA